MKLLRLYAGLVHALRAQLERRGLLKRLDEKAAESTRALWVRSLLSVMDFEDFTKLDLPWWTFAASKQVSDFLSQRPEARVLEWGSGSSTVWLAKRSASVTSIESDAGWAQMVSASVPEYVAIVTPPVPAATAATLTRSKRWGYRSLDFTSYVSAIDSVPGFFDLIVIDGRAREACFDRALPRLNSGGLIVFDNSNRRRYRRALRRHREDIAVTLSTGLTPILPWPSTTALVTRRSR
jgi:predicted O-methyltransferase YrrM